jgi:hypothetical protein
VFLGDCLRPTDGEPAHAMLATSPVRKHSFGGPQRSRSHFLFGRAGGTPPGSAIWGAPRAPASRNHPGDPFCGTLNAASFRRPASGCAPGGGHQARGSRWPPSPQTPLRDGLRPCFRANYSLGPELKLRPSFRYIYIYIYT